MTGNGKVAIYMCCYNHAKYVAEAIESIVSQAYTNWELWMANDGSTDDSAQIMASYESEKIHFFNLKNNTKLVGAQGILLNEIKKSDCEYIACIAADDKWKAEKLEKQIKLMSEHEEYGACFSWDEILFEDGTEQDPFRMNTEYSHQQNRSRYEWIYTYTLYDNWMNACSALVKKDIFFEFGGYNQYFIGCGDFKLWFDIVLKYPIYVIQEPLLYYRRHKDNLSKRSNGVVQQMNSELYSIKYKNLNSISKHDFYRSYYRELIYCEGANENYFWADKIFFIISAMPYENVYNQIAVSMWLDKSDDQEYMRLLEKRYGFNNSLLTELKAQTGLGALLLNQLGINDRYSYEWKGFEEYFLLLYEQNVINEQNISNFLWNPIYRFALYVETSGNGEKLFKKMRQSICEYRKRASENKKEKIIHILCNSELKGYVGDIIGGMADDNKYYISFVCKKTEYFDTNVISEESCDCGAVYIDIYDSRNKALYFSYEQGINADVVYYVDCLGDEYECTDMLRGYSLGVTQMALISKSRFSDKNQLNAICRIMDNVDFL
ncbi:glycosyltransferase family 2 protein [Butyrivibrio sp. YAB3001]|uniref:glycosyltransferase family 2 protein n=1 Tax=Butyrivibrio sp. YAB3001 TaxID=1520812 RepID=UPI0008F687CD|nr:glycosyltransferase family 2 protein [Butyrivibrio sp. YAB3001]SFB94521.1 Glycosyltransferase, GT2 family [Butyrivibrio sp. YAB3001]